MVKSIQASLKGFADYLSSKHKQNVRQTVLTLRLQDRRSSQSAWMSPSGKDSAVHSAPPPSSRADS